MLKVSSPSGVALLVAFAAFGGLDLRVALRGEPELASPATMRAARDAIERAKRPGDLVVHSPLFTLEELSPLGDLVVSPALPQPELLRSRRVLVLDVVGAPMFGFGAPEEVTSIPGPGRAVELRVFGAARTERAELFDLGPDLDRAQMRVERPLGHVTSVCTAPRGEGGWSCPGEAEWLYLAERELTVEGASSTCVWAHPTTDGAVVIQIPAQPVPPSGRRVELRIAAAMADDAVRATPDGASVKTAVVQNGVERGSLLVPNRIGWFEAIAIVDPDVPIDLVVTTSRDGRRHHCIRASVRDVDAKAPTLPKDGPGGP